jgi:hypothetical protein
MRILYTLFAVLTLAAIPAVCTAQRPPPPSSLAASTLCQQSEVDPASYFPQMRESAIGVRRQLCVNGATRNGVFEALVAFIREQHRSKWFESFGGFENGTDPLMEALDSMNVEAQRVDTIAFSVSADPELLVGGGEPIRPASLAVCDRRAGDGDCAAVLQEFLTFYTYAHTTLASEGALIFASEVRGLSGEWNEYLSNSRSQTPLELLINSALFRHDETLQFSGPPGVQWIILHPSLVVENVEDALDGDNTQEALMIEVAGANWWRQDKWYVPSGSSLVAVYADRPEIEDFGYGVALHFRSVYSVGYTKHSGSDAIFVSFDLLKLLENKQRVIEQFKP